ncbi:hypothetical protein MIND_00542400 [Mycena indigotica]|uniref:Uncharacterized protein n=1 Tax=Mycena indigotica TaxID=2126181 RepID=A0A8H6WCK8_9AGAR|nr:uncharacterized protein MIND_00542400 [Mycena indigotica]KAF7307479.1 hypothetical protein MIND_00542400 [Mycena indigotica]
MPVASTAVVLRAQGSQALVRQNQQLKPVIPGLGRTLNELYDLLGTAAGAAANRAAHRLGFGPLAISEHIRRHFDNEGVEGREKRIHALPTRDLRRSGLGKDCRKLVAYTLPMQSTKTQIEALECVVELSTRYPGLRRFFIEAKTIKHEVPSPISINGLYHLWKPPNRRYLSEEEAADLDFAAKLAAACLVDSNLASLMEESPDKNPNIGDYNSNGLTVIECLLVVLWSRTPADPSVALAISQAHSSTNVLRKLGQSIAEILEDMDIEETTIDLSEPPLMDLDGLDILCAALLSGTYDLIARHGLEQDREWHQSTLELVLSLRFPKSEALLPCAYAWATSEAFRGWFDAPVRLQTFTVVAPLTDEYLWQDSEEMMHNEDPFIGGYSGPHTPDSGNAESMTQDSSSLMSFPSDQHRSGNLSVASRRLTPSMLSAVFLTTDSSSGAETNVIPIRLLSPTRDTDSGEDSDLVSSREAEYSDTDSEAAVNDASTEPWMSLHGYSEDEESPILRQFVNDTIAREELTPSPRTELLSPTEANRSQHEVDRVRHSQRGPSDRFRRQREQAYGGLPPEEMLAMLIEREYEGKRLRKTLSRAFERLEDEVKRAAAAEIVTQQTLDKFREANRAKSDAERLLAKRNEELRMWKFQFEHAQKEISRAQEVVQLVETQRDEAERAAAKTRTLARRLKEEKLVTDAMEEGRKLGFKAGLRRAQEEIALRQGLDPEDRLTIDDDYEQREENGTYQPSQADGISILDAASIRPRRRLSPERTSQPIHTIPNSSPAQPNLMAPESSRPQPPETARSPSFQLSIYPIEIPPPSVLNDAPQSRRPSLQVQTDFPSQPPATSTPTPQRLSQPRDSLFINRRVSAVPPPPVDEPPPRKDPTPPPQRYKMREPPPVPPPREHWSQLPHRPSRQPMRQPSPQPMRQPSPQPMRQPSPQPQRQPSPQPARPPDNYIPSVSPDGDIPLPPPFILANPLMASPQAPSPEPLMQRTSSWYNNREPVEREKPPSWYQPPRRPRSNAGSTTARSVASGRSGYNPHMHHVSLDSAAAQFATSSKMQKDPGLGAIREDASVRSGHRRSVSGQERRVNGHDQGRRSVSMMGSTESFVPPPIEKDPRHQRQTMADELRYSNPDFAASMRGAGSSNAAPRNQPPRNVRVPAQLTTPAPLSPSVGTAHLRARSMSGSSQGPPVDLVPRQSLRRVKEKRPVAPSDIGSPMSDFGGGMQINSPIYAFPPQTEQYLSPNYPTEPLPAPAAEKAPLGFVPQALTVPAEITVPVALHGKSISTPGRPRSTSLTRSPLPTHIPMNRPPSMNGSSTSLALAPQSLSRQASNASLRSAYGAYDAKTYVDPAYYAADTGYNFGAGPPPRPISMATLHSRPRSRANSAASSHSALSYMGPHPPA